MFVSVMMMLLKAAWICASPTASTFTVLFFAFAGFAAISAD